MISPTNNINIKRRVNQFSDYLELDFQIYEDLRIVQDAMNEN